jgi:predicted phosphodiesterase
MQSNRISMRVFAISDLHIDYAANREWLQQLSLDEYRDDVLILAGDVSDSLAALAECFAALTRRFAKVMFVPGNHELWVRRERGLASLAKFEAVRKTAQDYGIDMQPWSHGSTIIVPLLGWYDFSFGTPDEELRSIWMDFHACVWPEDWNEAAIARHFTDHNVLPDTRLIGPATTVITFSHFLPRIDVMPASIPERFRNIYPVLGTTLIEHQLRSVGSSLHVYGHSHVNRAVVIDGVNYVNNALGYPGEARFTSRELRLVHEA